MTLLQMSYILEVDRCGSMNRAAQNLFLSQSALSAAIAEAVPLNAAETIYETMREMHRMSIKAVDM